MVLIFYKIAYYIQNWILWCVNWRFGAILIDFSLKTVFNENIAILSARVEVCSSSVQFGPSVVSDSLWPHELQHAKPPCPSPTNSRNLFKLMSIESVMPSNLCWMANLILCHLLLLLPSIFLSIRVFSNESALHIRWPKYWNFSFHISPSNEYSGLISFRMDWLDLLAVQGTLKSLFQHHSSKHQFFGAQLSL